MCDFKSQVRDLGKIVIYIHLRKPILRTYYFYIDLNFKSSLRKTRRKARTSFLPQEHEGSQFDSTKTHKGGNTLTTCIVKNVTVRIVEDEITEDSEHKKLLRL